MEPAGGAREGTLREGDPLGDPPGFRFPLGNRLHARLREAWGAATLLLSPLSDPTVRWSIRLLTVSALVLFVLSLLLYIFPAFVAAIACAVLAYVFTREDVRRHPVRPSTRDLRADDDRGTLSPADVEAVYAPSAAGIPFSFERRVRPPKPRG